MAERKVHIPIEKPILVDLYCDRGLTLPEIAEEMHVSTSTIHRRMTDHGIPTRNPGARPASGDRQERPAEVLTREFLVAVYQRDGMSTTSIAAQTGFSTYTIRVYLRRYGLPVRPVGSIPRYAIDREQLAKARRAGFTVEQIAARLGCSTAAVRRALRRYSLTPPSEAPAVRPPR
jgi:DNA-binding NarL/FixJ family response regulator